MPRIFALRGLGTGQHALDTAFTTILGRLVAGLHPRHLAGAGPITIVPCDNFPRNGALVASAVAQLSGEVSQGLRQWIANSVSFVSTSVDRITPRVDNSLTDTVVQQTGWLDLAPVATEPFTDWTIAGEFPAGRPAWETGGATFVNDIEPYGSRKLWLLNGAHSILASLGRLRGHTTVSASIADPVCRSAVDTWWDDPANHLPRQMEIATYRGDLLKRFANPRLERALDEIAAESLTKFTLRIVPVALLELQAGREAAGAASAIAAWITATLTHLPSNDSRATEIATALNAPEPARALLALLSPSLAADDSFAKRVTRPDRNPNRQERR